MAFSLGIPQVVFIVVMALELGIIIARWGQKKTGTYGANDFFGTAIVLVLLWWGGFFR